MLTRVDYHAYSLLSRFTGLFCVGLAGLCAASLLWILRLAGGDSVTLPFHGNTHHANHQTPPTPVVHRSLPTVSRLSSCRRSTWPSPVPSPPYFASPPADSVLGLRQDMRVALPAPRQSGADGLPTSTLTAPHTRVPAQREKCMELESRFQVRFPRINFQCHSAHFFLLALIIILTLYSHGSQACSASGSLRCALPLHSHHHSQEKKKLAHLLLN